jgi:hypothetical protein
VLVVIDGLLTKYDTDGNLIWQRILGGASSDIFYSVALDSSGNIYVAGYTNSQGAGGRDGLLTKYDTNGNLIWQRILGGANNDEFYSVALDSSGNIYVAGYTNSQGAGGDDGLLTKYDTDGNLIWQRLINAGITPLFIYYSLRVFNDNIYTIGERYANTDYNSYSAFLAKLPTDGTILSGGDWSFEQANLTSATSTLTANTSTLTANTSTLTANTSTLTANTSTFITVRTSLS